MEEEYDVEKGDEEDAIYDSMEDDLENKDRQEQNTTSMEKE